MDAGALISKKDWESIKQALTSKKEILMEREMGRLYVRITTERVNSPVWKVKTLCGIEMRSGGMYMRQWFASAEEARHYVRGWKWDG